MDYLLQIYPESLKLLCECFLYFFVGIVEAFIANINLLFLQQKHKSGCFITSVFNSVIFYTVIITITQNEQFAKLNLNNPLVWANSIGMGTGEVFAIIFYAHLTKLAKKVGKELKKFQKICFMKKRKR